MAWLQPWDLYRMGTCHEDDLLRFAIVAAAFRSRADKELVAAPLRLVFAAIERKLQFVRLGRQTRGRRHLRHRAMKRRVPGRIITRMTCAAGIRTHITSDS